MNIKLIEQKNKAQAISFLNYFSSKKRTMTEWDWEFNSYKLSPQIFVIAQEDDEVIGAQALLPIPLSRSNQNTLSSKSEETLVHPDYRGKNVFSLMYQQVFSKAISNGVQLIWGFTGAKKPFSKIGFSIYNSGLNNYLYVTSIKKAFEQHCVQNHASGIKGILKLLYFLVLFIVIKSTDVIRYKPISKHNSYRTSIINGFDIETDNLQKSILEDYPDLITIDRNSAYMNWRISENPYYCHQIIGLYLKNKLVGYSVIARLDNSMELSIVDIIIRPDHVEQAIPVIIGTIKRIARDEKMGYITFRLMPCSNNYTTGILNGIRKTGFFKSYGTMPFILKILNDEIKDTYSDVNKWYINGLMTEGVAHRG